jgi:beta-lactamase class D
MKLHSGFIYCCTGLLFCACQPTATKETETTVKTVVSKDTIVDYKKYYDEFGVTGSLIIYNQNKDSYIYFNKDQYKQPFIPASSFKILNSLIGLETGVIKDENFVIKWDGTKRQNPNWNKDHNLKTAFQNSTVWYYQELARRVGGKQMKHYLDLASYGNADTTGGIDKFWLTGNLRITPEQQLIFLRRLYDNQLPFSQRSIDIVKQIMLSADSTGYPVRAKTGWGGQDSLDIGWYVGWAEKNNNVYYFVNCVQMGASVIEKDDNAFKFDHSRKEIVYKVLETLK